MSRELDARVAVEVMGWEVAYDEVGRLCQVYEGRLANDYPDKWHPSEDIKAAWMVVEKMKRHGIAVHTPQDEEKEPQPWKCVIGREDGTNIVVRADTAPEAICLAALKAVKE